MCAKWSHRDQLEPIKTGSPPALRGTGWDAEGTCDQPTGCVTLMEVKSPW